MEHAILKTLAYFDCFNRPLTQEEIERYVWQPSASTQGIGSAISAMKEAGSIGYHAGYFFLLGREETVPAYQANIWLVEKKMKIAARAARKMRWWPFILGVFVCNTVAMGSPRKESDVDLFIVVKSGRLWFTRLAITVWLSLFGIRRSHTHVADHVCLSFYHTDESLSLQPLAILPDDVYLIYWLTQLVPLYDSDNTLEEIQKANAWIKAYVPNAFQSYALGARWQVRDTRATRVARNVYKYIFGRSVGDWCERISKKIQVWKMGQNRSSTQNTPDTRVVISDTMLKFHENDRRAVYRERWLAKCEDLRLKD